MKAAMSPVILQTFIAHAVPSYIDETIDSNNLAIMHTS